MARAVWHTLLVATALPLGCASTPPGPAPPPVAGEVRTQFAMRYVDLQPGTGALAEPGKCFYAHYTGWLTDGKKFDSSRDTTREGKPRTPLGFEQGKRNVIAGWDAGFEGMRVGARRRLIIPYQLAYGEKGRPPVIPPKATLVFDVELMDVRDAPAATRPPEPPARCPSWDQRTAAAPQQQGDASLPRVRFTTSFGDIVVEIDTVHAPLTGRNFLRYVDGHFYDGGRFMRTVRDDNQPNDSVRIAVVQAASDSARRGQEFPAIPLERTSMTGLRHRDGTLSMARAGPETATSSFFICIGDQPALDFGGRRNLDGQGFAAFGRVVDGMDVVRRINAAAAEGQRLTPAIAILRAARS